MKCFGLFLETLYHFMVHEKVKIGEKCPTFYRFQVENRGCQTHVLVSTASRICELKNIAAILEDEMLTKLWLKLGLRSHIPSIVDQAKASATCSSEKSLKKYSSLSVYNNMGNGHQAFSME